MTTAKRLAFSLFTIVAVWTLLELGARAYEFVAHSPDTQSAMYPFSPHPVLHHTMKPDPSLANSNPTRPHENFANPPHWIDESDLPRKKPEGVYRIFFVGDSNTQGLVDPGFKMADRVEKALAGWPLDREVEVINTGTSSYSGLLYYLTIKHHILEHEPDLIIVNVDMTDVPNDYFYRRQAVFSDRGEPVAVQPRSVGEESRVRLTPTGLLEIPHRSLLAEQVLRHSALARVIRRLENFVAKRTRRLTGEPKATDESPNWLALEWSPGIEENVSFSADILAQTARLVESKDVGFALTSVPFYGQYTGEYSTRPHAALEAVAEESGVPFLNGYSALEDRVRGTDVSEYYWDTDPTHLNEAGNAIWARAMTRFVGSIISEARDDGPR